MAPESPPSPKPPETSVHVSGGDAPDVTSSAGRSPAAGLEQAPLANLLGRYAVVFGLVILAAAFSILLSGFGTVANFKSMVNSQSLVLLLAIAATIPLRAGDFDLSIAANMTFSAAIAAQMLLGGLPIPLVLLAVVATGLLIGCVNSFLVVGIGVDSLITTLGMMTALLGGTYAVTDSKILYGVTGTVAEIAHTDIIGFPGLTWAAWVAVAVCWYVFERTPLGRHLLFVGGSRESARLAGLPVARLRVGAYLASGTISALTGLFLLGWFGAIDPNVGSNYLLPPIVAAFLGATTIHIGRFNAVGTMIGLYLLIVGITGLQILGAEPWLSNIFNGTALVLAVTLARLASRRTE